MKPTKILLIFLLLVGLAFLTFLLLPKPGGPVMPEPNGYVTVVEAGKALSESNIDPRKLDPVLLEDFVRKNSAVLGNVRAGLTQQSHVPWPGGSNAQGQVINHSSDLTVMKRLGQAFVAETELARQRGQWSNAVASIEDTLRLSRVSSRGGPMIDALIGVAIEAMATAEAEIMLTQLPASESRRLAAAFESFDRSRPTASEVMDNEVRWTRAMLGFKADFLRLMTRSLLKKSQASFEQKLAGAISRTRILMLNAAARAYEQEKGRPADSVAALVPDYLKVAPMDPYSKAPLKLR